MREKWKALTPEFWGSLYLETKSIMFMSGWVILFKRTPPKVDL